MSDPCHYIGTKFSWKDSKDPKIFSIAIQTKNGVLQVKTHNGTAKTMFHSPAEWRRSLPKGSVTITSPVTDDILSSLPEGFTDIQKLRELQRRFKVKTECTLLPSGHMNVVHKTSNKIGIYRNLTDLPTYLGYYYSNGEEYMIDETGNYFKTFYGAGSHMTDGKPYVVAYYHGHYLNLTSLLY
jgi:hypothetical protein